MALTSMTVQRDGWHLQAEHLALTHTPTGMAAMAAVEQLRRRPLLKRPRSYPRTFGTEFDQGLEEYKIDLTNELEQTRAKLTERDTALAHAKQRIKFLAKRVAQLEQLVLREAAASRRAAAADRPVAELDGRLTSAREELVHRENENQSLQRSFDLIVCENSRLSCRLAESDSEVNKLRSQLEQMKTTRTVAEIDRNKLNAAVNEAIERRQTEINTLNTRLEAASSRAVAAEKVLAEVRHRLLVRTAENSIAERKAADATVTRNAADKELKLLQNSLQMKEREVQELEQSRSKLIEATTILLKTFKRRETTLARAEKRIKLLGERFAELEAKANRIKSQEKIDELNPQLPCERARRETHTNWAELHRELEDYIKHDNRYSEQIQLRSTEALLASTITF